MDTKSTPCSICKNPATSRCSGCNLSYYCSKDCQKIDWKSHKPECKKNQESYKNIYGIGEIIHTNLTKNCSNCSKKLSNEKITCNICESVAYCSEKCKIACTNSHVIDCKIRKITQIAVFEMVKIFYIENNSNYDPEIIEAIDEAINEYKLNKYGRHSKTHLLNSIMVEYTNMTISSPGKRRQAKEYTAKQIDDYLAGRREL
jgi:hypothetical protein